MAVPRRPRRRRFPIVLVVLTAITLLTLDLRGFGPLDSARSWAMWVVAPVGDVTSAVVEPISDRWHAAFSSDDIQAENEELRRRVDELEGQLTRGQVAQESLRQVLEHVDIPFVDDYATATAKVVSGAVGNFDTTVELDKGSRHGIERGMPVITGRGLIGRVDQLSDTRARVQLVTDGSIRVGFQVVGTPHRGIAEGTGRSGELIGTVDAEEAVAIGQTVVTSGLETSPYPPDVPIGTITEVEREEGVGQQRLTITMVADLGDLTFASVVLYTPDLAVGPASALPDA